MDGCYFVVIGFLVLLPRASKCFKKLACPGVGLLFLLSSSGSNSCSEIVWTSISILTMNFFWRSFLAVYAYIVDSYCLHIGGVINATSCVCFSLWEFTFLNLAHLFLKPYVFFVLTSFTDTHGFLTADWSSVRCYVSCFFLENHAYGL